MVSFAILMLSTPAFAQMNGEAVAPALPPISIQPRINVPPVPSPTITVQVPAAPAPIVNVAGPPSGFWRTWLPVFVAMLSAAIAAASALMAWNSQRFGFRKDAAAIARELRARRTLAAMQAFENNVARPVGMTLDVLESLVGAIAQTRPKPVQEEVDARSMLLSTQYANALRLCTEADGALPGPTRHPFQELLAGTDLDEKLLAATKEALTRHEGSRANYDTALAGLAHFKVTARKLLETERLAEERRWAGDIRDDPFYEELQRLLTPAHLELLLGLQKGEIPGAPTARSGARPAPAT
ncbi:MAG: hypothetical protein J0H14_14470 [Alphaproteobacteria bacterium]|nr:hypothetical protein [Alphaproteobacteria bacterium]